MFKFRFGCLAVLMGLCVACTVTAVYYTEEKRLAKDAAARVHQLLNDAKYEEIYELTDETAKAKKSKSDLVNLMKYVRENRGRVVETSLDDREITPHDNFLEVTDVYRTKFENGIALEQFIWYVSNGQAKLYSYAQSDDTTQ